jgi:2-polyprenyl-6-methoxyphenol hydroxylase-like FAD-dependent oxidoreductase
MDVVPPRLNGTKNPKINHLLGNIHDGMELSALLGRVIRKEAAPDILDLYDRVRRPLNVEYVQQQTIANKKRLEEKDPAHYAGGSGRYWPWRRPRDWGLIRRTLQQATKIGT